MGGGGKVGGEVGGGDQEGEEGKEGQRAGAEAGMFYDVDISSEVSDYVGLVAGEAKQKLMRA